MFEYLIEDFKTYKPLLSAIKHEYEMMLVHQREKMRELEPLKVFPKKKHEHLKYYVKCCKEKAIRLVCLWCSICLIFYFLEHACDSF